MLMKLLKLASKICPNFPGLNQILAQRLPDGAYLTDSAGDRGHGMSSDDRLRVFYLGLAIVLCVMIDIDKGTYSAESGVLSGLDQEWDGVSEG